MFSLFLILLQYLFIPILFPLTNILLPLFVPFFKKRILFEKTNQLFEGSESFQVRGEMADLAFEVASEGELEQIRPVIDEFIGKNKKIEIIYSSDSVEGNIIKLYRNYPEMIRVFRLPIISYFPFFKTRSVRSWMTAQTLILCRYDFYPELVLIGLQKKVRFILLQATLIGKDKVLSRRFGPSRLILKYIYRSFDEIVCSTKNDKSKFERFFHIDASKIKVMELRILQIQRRLDTNYDKLMKYPFWPLLSDFINNQNRNNLIIMGNYWADESNIFSNTNFVEEILKKKVIPVIVPHLLKEENLEEIISSNIKLNLGLNIYQINAVDSEERVQLIIEEYEKSPGIIMLNCKGILVELYSFFGHVYVGGGFNRSVHSILEPYLAKAKIYLGPKKHRSTEFLVAKENSPKEIYVLNNIEDFFEQYKKNQDVKSNPKDRRDLVSKTRPSFDHFLKTFSIDREI